MKHYLFLLGALLLLTLPSKAQKKSEQQLIAAMFKALQMQNDSVFATLFANTDSLCDWVMKNTEVNSASYQKMYFTKHNEATKNANNTLIQQAIQENLDSFLEKSKLLDVHWNKTVFIRYELDKIRTGRGLMIEKIASNRFLGYLYFRDEDTRKHFVFTVYDIFQVHDYWYGGELVNIYEGQNKEDYEKAYRKELRLLLAKRDDTTSTSENNNGSKNTDNRPANTVKEVVGRKFYKGKFDNEISVQLYVRYIKGPCDGGVCSWEAIFKFGDEDEYVYMDVSKTDEGSWLFTEDLGGMELTLRDGVYTGNWAASDSKAEYDVNLKEVNLSSKKAKQFDEAIELMNSTE